ncbi:MAG: hypothetical protein MPEBLZ_02770 [Candidatus Methanoperedens nitroreducens]|uniref:Uncharacterized protein n=1 Tax=Candidatus Methanoperedens nitratireducens TaxID=1392998 RepID=A0A0P8A3F7_9EURY|nr:hypothetical protein [Candidatus Methanoperedens sp. BLZ2]KAB2947362.1 MAG: hypothetical protein F9K14_04710 [Candidatus Methanoperedens sp.]KPQ42675.1 MAG: hypothetical protein MPEBLZ_02770 [Candidatus Methanoperedens sp. BLZ1]MBZ0175494.1 hypothetical protein [Candidatus Methanoperedens nitroreducens]CAG0957914.1 hypothetical protein METP2_00609 [Methanosarcinales archaeon]MCX9080227.1 hypothetical protein [Candidatus Methanoperedens sp.]
MTLGDIIRVEDARAYVAKIPPDAKKERIGSFVKIKKDDGLIVGVIKNITNSIREDLIPYINHELAPKYAPFNEDFRNSYYVLHGLGTIRNGIVKYDIDSPPDVRDKVEMLNPEELKFFHTIDGKQSIAYFHSNCDALSQNVLIAMVDQIEAQCPECRAMFALVRKYIKRNL